MNQNSKYLGYYINKNSMKCMATAFPMTILISIAPIIVYTIKMVCEIT